MPNKVLFQLCCLMTMLCVASLSPAADKYVRKGASGSGTSWSDAYGDFNTVSWSGMTSGNTLWVAAGSYTGSLPSISTSGLSIKRATVASHGTSTGWSDAYDDQVTVNPSGQFLSINANNTTVDGASHSPWKFRVVGVKSPGGMILIDANNGTVRNMDMDGNYESGPDGGNEDCFRIAGGDSITLEYNFIHDYIYAGGSHSDGVQMPSGTNFIYRYNISRNNGMHVFLGDVAWYGSSGWVNNVKIYGNVFYNTNSYYSYDTIDCKNCTSNSSYYFYIENNTFDTLNAYGNRVLIYQNGGSTAQLYFRNNILYNSSPNDATSGIHSYNNYYGTTAPTETGAYVGDPQFTDRTNHIYSLKPTSPVKDIGTNLGYTQDIVDTALPTASGSGYPMGAYAVGTAGATKPAAPTSLTVR